MLQGYDSRILRDWEPELRRERLVWRDTISGNAIHARPEALVGGILAEDSLGDRLLTGIGLTLHGTVLGKLAFYSHGVVFTESTEKAQFSHQFSPEKGETYSVEKGSGDFLQSDRTFNRHEFYLKYTAGALILRAGRDWVHLGPGYFSSLTASRETPPYHFAEARLEFAPWLFLDNYVLRMVDTDHSILKFAHIHRFEFKPGQRLSLGFQDAVIYQDRDLDTRYLLPLVPLTFTEQNTGGLDNSAMMFDFIAVPFRGLSIWGEIFLDDLLGPGAFLEDWWENRWAVLGGFQVVSPWEGFDADLILELTHVEPWTYIGRSPQTGFKHFNVPSASSLGPDSRSLQMRLAWRPWSFLQLKTGWFIGAKGTQAGSRLDEPHDNAKHGTDKTRLAGRRDVESASLEVDFLLGRTAQAMLGAEIHEGDFADPKVAAGVRVVW